MSNLENGIKYLKDYNRVKVPSEIKGFDAFRALMNITMPDNLSEEFYKIQDRIIEEEYSKRTIVDINSLLPFIDNIYLYKGDITLLKVDSIVDACNSELLGCFHPLHKCIDNAIHSFAGLEMRRDLINIMNGKSEENGKARITKGYNLPSKYVLHTVGPIVNGKISEQNEIDLYNCYQSCLNLANSYKLESIAFPSISTGIYRYPINEASKIAIKAVKNYLLNNSDTSIKRVVFNVFSKEDYNVYKRRISEAYSRK